MTQNDWISCSNRTPLDGDAHAVILADAASGRKFHAIASYPIRPQDRDVPLVNGWRLWYVARNEDDERATHAMFESRYAVTAWRDLENLNDNREEKPRQPEEAREDALE